MKKLLLASVAALAVTAFAAGQAVAAEANDGLKLGLGGYHSVHGAFVDQDETFAGGAATTTIRDFDIFSYGEINFWAEKTFDNGLTVGYKAVTPIIPGGTGSVTENFNENFAYFSGYWGRIVAGQDYSPLYYMTMGAPVVDPGIDGIEPDFNFVNVQTTAFTAANVAATGFGAGAGNFNTAGFRPFERTGGELGDKIAYYTPRFNGFQAGASYTPEFNRTNATAAAKTALTGFANDAVAFEQSERLEIAANYEGSFWNGVGLKVGGGYGHANLEAQDNVLNEDQDAWNAGVHLSYLGWTFGGGYLWDDNGQSYAAGAVTADGETDAWNAGVTYDWGPWRAGVSYLNKQTEVLRTVSGDDEFDRWVVAGAYKVAPGVDLGATLQFHDYDTVDGSVANPTGNNEATVFTVGTTVNF